MLDARSRAQKPLDERALASRSVLRLVRGSRGAQREFWNAAVIDLVKDNADLLQS